MKPEVVERINDEVSRLREKYNPSSVADLEKIAKNEYGVVKVINTPLVLFKSVINSSSDGFRIFYHASFKPYGPLLLGKEIGRIFMGNLNDDSTFNLGPQSEADYFSRRLNDVSLVTSTLYEELNTLFITGKLLITNITGEKQKLKENGLYDLLKTS